MLHSRCISANFPSRSTKSPSSGSKTDSYEPPAAATAPRVVIFGDAHNTGQPKSAHTANLQAKVCVDAIIRSLDGKSNYDEEGLAKLTTSSACYRPVSIDQASWLTASFADDPAAGGMKLTRIGEAERWSRKSCDQMFASASNLVTDSFH